MCAVVAYTGFRDASALLFEGLKKLEYRGYDSAGLALQDQGKLIVVKTAGSIEALQRKAEGKLNRSTTGIGHSRWATHGRPTDENAHPHVSCCDTIALVHNGIIENHHLLRAWLRDRAGHRFRSQTDTEVLVHLMEEYYDGDLLGAVLKAIGRVEGSYALAVLAAGEPSRLVCARKESPLIIGLGENENFVASDIPALLAHTRRTYIMEDGEVASITPSGVDIFDGRGQRVTKKIFEVGWSAVAAEKGGHAHFMFKEILEQPLAIRETLRRRINSATGKVNLSELEFDPELLRTLEKIYIVACGTSHHAGLAGKYVLENLVGLPVEVDLASEFRYRDPLLIPQKHLVVVISQSGETADTLAALRLSRKKGVTILAVTNVVGSSVSREADRVLYTRAGPEVAVASTKAYLTQLVALYLLALYLGDVRAAVSPEMQVELARELTALPAHLDTVLAVKNLDRLQVFSRRLAGWEHAFFLGRNLDFAVAMEGSLKLKEVSYIHAEALPAGELKHGALALITEGFPTIVLATQEALFKKTLSNIQEIIARGGVVFAVTPEGHREIASQADAVFYLPPVNGLFMPILAVVPLQLIAYYTAVARRCPVDRPRNLAKSITVE